MPTKCLPPTFSPSLASIPVLSTTLLRLELLQCQNSLDLRAATRLLCADPGALLHLFATVAQESSSEDVRFRRVEDYIASIPLDLLLCRLVDHAVSSPQHQAILTSFAHHASLISQYAFTVADSFHLSSDQALLVGSLHDLAQLPSLLGWQPAPATTKHALLLCSALCRRYHLPTWLCAALSDVHNHAAVSLWTAVTAAAHELAGTQVNVV